MTATRPHPEHQSLAADARQLMTPRMPAPAATRLWLRMGALLAIGAGLIPLYVWLVPAARAGVEAPGFGWLLGSVTALYLAACALILRMRPVDGAWRWAELALILLIGLALRALVFGSPPTLSPDAYRYAWDPHLIVHGFSPYTHTPLDPALTALRDHNIWPNLRFRNAPTIYPPAAQALFLLAYAAAPLNIFGVKAVIEIGDALSCLLTLVLLRQRGLDLRRIILYWWAPIPIIEFALNAHVDAEAILWTLAALAMNSARWRGSRAATGALIGLATMTKLYPLIFVIAFIRRRDYGLLAGLVGSLIVGYAPFIALGLGSGGFLGAYLSQRFVDQGVLLTWLDTLITPFTQTPPALVAADLLALALCCGLIALYRWRLGLDAVACLLALSIAWILLSPHIFPWYIGALLPLVALSRGGAAASWLGGRAMSPAALACWLFALAVPYTYLLFLPGGPNGLFPWLFIAAAAVGLAPLLIARERADCVARLRRLFAAPTLAEVRRFWRACLPAGWLDAQKSMVS
ncbi:MAG TPA: hypothetical protein VE338_16215 [Ktedonobacterales bacterium]|jgi:hypothetical protein|nr:hypothetical protein [Ktedonobacterales bacterium]